MYSHRRCRGSSFNTEVHCSMFLDQNDEGKADVSSVRSYIDGRSELYRPNITAVSLSMCLLRCCVILTLC